MPFSTQIGKIRQSLVVWVNGIVLVMAGVPLALEPVRDLLPPTTFGWLLLATNLFNLAARIFFTNKPLTATADQRP